MKVALWGFGTYGRYVLDQVEGPWSTRHEVTAIFDRGFERFAEAELPAGLWVRDPATLEEGYRQGAFEAVICCVTDFSLLDEMMRSLDEKGIPKARLGKREDFRPSTGCAGAVVPPSLTWDNPGYELRETEGVFAIRASNGLERVYLYDAEGVPLEDNWFETDFTVYPRLLDHAFPPEAKPREARLLRGEYCLVCRLFGTNYWHYTFEALDQVLLMERAGFTGTYIAIRTPFSADLIRLAGIPEDRVLWLSDLEPGRPYLLEKVFAVYSPGGNRFTARVPELVELSKRVLGNLPSAPSGKEYPRRIFVKRIGTRRLLGADELLEDLGFVTIVPEELSVEEQIRHFNAADVVITPHGANNTNALYMRPGTSLVETFPKTWAIPSVMREVIARGVHYFPVIENPITEPVKIDKDRDYPISRTLLRNILESAIVLAEANRGD